MSPATPHPTPASHPGFDAMFAPGETTLGLMFPMAPLTDGVADMRGQRELAARADALGFAALWSRDVPLFDPAFGDAGQVYDPWVWMGQVAAVTRRIALSAAGIVLPLRHPLHVAKAAASVDAVSGARFVMGLASGDRAVEYPAFGRDHATRGDAYRAGVATIRSTSERRYPDRLAGLDLLPKPPAGTLPLLAVGSARQSVQWIAEHMDGWITYPRDIADQRARIDLWRSATAARAPGLFRPFAQSLFIDLTDDPKTPKSEIFLGFRLGRDALIDHLSRLRELGANHVTFNLRHATRPAAEVIEELGAEVLPHFPTHRPRRGARAA